VHFAPLKKTFELKQYPEVKFGVVDWYNTVLRLESKNREQISKLATDIVYAWKAFSDVECGIIDNTAGVQHNSVAPVCRKTSDGYVFDIILRNNRTNEEYPDGIFHAHPEYHNIKKESIGLIEAMGLFILPGRLKKQLGMIAEILCKKAEYNEKALAESTDYLYAHRRMIKELIEEGYAVDMERAEKRVTNKVNNVCKNILINTAVFKDDEAGNKGLERFLSRLGV